jgi:predicted phosphodiesterase
MEPQHFIFANPKKLIVKGRWKLMNILSFIRRDKKSKMQEETPKEQKVQTPIRGKRILIISDIHYTLTPTEEKIFSQEFDQCWILGDISSQIVNALMYSAKYPVYGVLGNHDSEKSFCLKENSLVPKRIEIQNINKKLVNEDGFSITGISGSSRYKSDPNYVMITQEESLELFNEMEKADILISHDSAFNIHSKEKNKEGLKGITEYINKYQPKLHIYGHHHNFHSYNIGDTLCICNFRFGIIEPDGTYHSISNNL